MSKQLTPAEAFEHVKALWPSVRVIYITQNGSMAREHGGHEKSPIFTIDWPDGVTEWPPQPKWETPVLLTDLGKECEFSADSEEWFVDILVGVRKYKDGYLKWEGARYLQKFCRIDRNRYPLEVKQ